jgi:hypothetical protein
MTRVLRLARFLAAACGTYLILLMTLCSRSATSDETGAFLLMYRLTVATDTPASRATSRIVTEEDRRVIYV